LCFLEQGVDVGPELPPGFLFGLGQGGQRLLVAHAGQVEVLLPQQERPLNQGFRRGRVRVELLGPQFQVLSATPVL
jgi:hypothetical protein